VFCLIVTITACSPKETQKEINSKDLSRKVELNDINTKNVKYWPTIKKELKLTTKQIDRLKKLRKSYNTKLREGKISKDKLLKARKKNEADVLRSNKAIKRFKEFNKSWNKNNGK